jgi:hypothetical protein
MKCSKFGLQLNWYCNIFLGLEIIKFFLKMSKKIYKGRKNTKISRNPKVPCFRLVHHSKGGIQ